MEDGVKGGGGLSGFSAGDSIILLTRNVYRMASLAGKAISGIFPRLIPSSIMIVRTVFPALAALFAVLTPVFAQVPSALVHSIPPPTVGAQSGAKLGFSVAVD